MHIHDLRSKRICILGFGREGQATLKAIKRLGIECDVTIRDQNENVQFPISLPAPRLRRAGNSQKNIKIQTGKNYLEGLARFDVIIKSPGIPPNSKLPFRASSQLRGSGSRRGPSGPNGKTQNSKLTSATQIFFDSIAGTGAIVIGVTGSKGKSTTSSLIYEILKAARRHNPYLIGNIGKPALDYLEYAKPETVFVMELSSYQLMDLTVSPPIAIITSFFPEHLDYHGSLDTYKEAKKHITRFQNKNDTVFFSTSSPGSQEVAEESPGKKIPFSVNDCPLPLEETQLIGEHNRSNIAAAWKVALHLHIDGATALKAIRGFHGLPHRLQSLGIHKDIEWIDDAISTTPESTIAALAALGDRVGTIILGGQDRGNDFTQLAKTIASSSIKSVILFPGSGPRIKNAIKAAKAHVEFFEAGSMEEAVRIAMRSTKKEVRRTKKLIVLLSNASPSYNMFKNFEEKGETFKRCILMKHTKI